MIWNILPAVFVFLAAFGTGWAQIAPNGLGTVQRDFDMRFSAGFLEPGIGSEPSKPGDEMVQGQIDWISESQGRFPASMWLKSALVEFWTGPDRKKVQKVEVHLGTNGIETWRHRHGYVVRGGRYFWNGLGDALEPMDSSLGADSDRFLQNLWVLWAKRHLQKVLSEKSLFQKSLDYLASWFQDSENKVSSLAGMQEVPGDVQVLDHHSDLQKKIRLSYNRNGLNGPQWGDFHIRVWHIPIHVTFEIKPAIPTDHNPWIIQGGRFKVEYDQEEWRRRHGYRKGLFGGYSWDSDFPDPKPSISLRGPQWDDGMDRVAKYWAEVAIHRILDGLDQDLKQAISELGQQGGRRIEDSQEMMLETLQGLAEGSASWPQ